MKNRVLAAAAALAFNLALSGAAHADISVTDVLGRTVKVPEVPKRVVLGFYYEDYLAIVGPEAIDKVVALSLSTWKDWRPQQYARYEAALPRLKKLPDVGSTEDSSFSVEKVIAADPDLLILGAWNYDTIGESIKQLEAAGIPIVVLDYNAQTIEKHVQSTMALGKLMGQEQRARQLADQYTQAMQDIEQRIGKQKPSPKKVYVELAQNGPGTVGNSYGNSMWGALVTQLGGQNIAAGQVGNWGPLSPEYVLDQQPDLVFLAGSEWLNKPQAVNLGFGAEPAQTRERVAAYTRRTGWDMLPAVKQGQVHGIYHGGARTLSDYVYAQYIAKQLYPDAFADVDPAQNLRDFYRQWLPIPADGVFMMQHQPAAKAPVTSKHGSSQGNP
ncbi:MAG: ABC transporter substrate-binding protein [Lautropia sp.]|nr:ABC transporter substrate-binding protein [Lautropia sp.]